MKSLSVIVAPDVQDAVRAQAVYIALDSVDAAIAWEERLSATIQGLRDFHGHAIDPELSRRMGAIIQKFVFERTFLIY